MTGRALSASLEDYLEAILVLVDEWGHAHVKSIAERLDVTMPSVTGALHNLAERGLVNYHPYSTVTLTERGLKIASRVRNRHRAFHTFFEQVLGVAPDVAAENACRIEHAVDQTVLDCLVAFLEATRCAHPDTEPSGGQQ